MRKVLRMDCEDEITIVLGWPAKELSPNWRGHWSRKAKAAKVYRSETKLRTRLISGSRRHWKKGKITITVSPPNEMRRDLDNVLASLKPAIDGVVDAEVFVDDSQIEFTIRRGETIKGGLIVFTASGK